jgi:hypothetical protein
MDETTFQCWLVQFRSFSVIVVSGGFHLFHKAQDTLTEVLAFSVVLHAGLHHIYSILKNMVGTRAVAFKSNIMYISTFD